MGKDLGQARETSDVGLAVVESADREVCAAG